MGIPENNQAAGKAHLIDRLHWGVALTPLTTLILFYSSILYAGITLGQWPGRGGIDLMELTQTNVPLGIHTVLVFIFLALTSLSPLAWLVLPSQAQRIPSLSAYGIRFVAFIACLSFTLWVGMTDPGGFLNWFFD